MGSDGATDGTVPRILNLGVTGHREGNAAYDSNAPLIADVIARLFGALETRLTGDHAAPSPKFRLLTNLAHGTDLVAAETALARGWELLAPLPFGKPINLALNTPGLSREEVVKVAEGGVPDGTEAREEYFRLLAASEAARCLELSDQDGFVREGLERLTKVAPTSRAAQDINLLIAERTRAASMVTIEQSDVLVAVWDGLSPSASGGTRDTMTKALAAEVPVVWIDARSPAGMRLLADPADLVAALESPKQDGLEQIVEILAAAAEEAWAAMAQSRDHLDAGHWREKSSSRFHAYRRIEALFGGGGRGFGSIVQHYDHPGQPDQTSLGPMLMELENLPGADANFIAAIRQSVVPRFALADGIATYLSDAYRGGMVASFLLSAAAIIGGLAYLPVVGPELKWPFALLEFIVLCMIVLITIAGTRGNWHTRWFGTRRVAEYLRHTPIMLTLGCARPIGRWPKSRDSAWPELDARARTMMPGLPAMSLTHEYLKEHTRRIVRPYLAGQRDYHRGKAERLEKVHANLDQVSEYLFIAAIVSVGGYLALKALATLALIDPAIPDASSKLLTFLGVAFPTLGASLAGIRYFGDFERFAAISDITATKLDRLHRRADLLLAGTEREVNYHDFVDLAHAMSDVVIEEIESWQSIFGTKKMAVPV